MLPLISVVIPAYNAQKTILETIHSVLNQTVSNFEIIVINDGSRDNTLSLLSTISDPRLKVFSYENGGLSVARNRGISNAIGEFISFLDADDLWTQDKLELQVAALQKNPDAGVVYSWTQFIDEHSNLLFLQPPVYLEGDVYPHLLVSNFISSGSNIMVRRHYIDLVGEFDPAVNATADWDYYLRLAARCHFALVPQYQVLYRKSSQAMSSNIELMEKSILTVLNRSFASAPEHLQSLKNLSLGITYQYLSDLYFLNNLTSKEDLKQANQKLIQAVKIYPKILLQTTTHRLFIKITILRLLPPQYSQKLIKFISNLISLVSNSKTK
ncbi:glycosyltransferase family 2 protein [Pseudanabaena sp. PCC 6802]|uniref:glycosyltransferase family 2 protein n=1 Tax=Pseudanabaena sp. PCC 6802 TaxID=118173 RepID=UPI00034C3424|nr:glycosyltransferase [Pseudanabaena sp. PCC 6802]